MDLYEAMDALYQLWLLLNGVVNAAHPGAEGAKQIPDYEQPA